MASIEQYWEAVREKVCEHCVDSDGYGNCRLSESEECALKSFFSRIVDTVASVKSDQMEPYVEALRGVVCAQCRHQSAEGNCAVRNRVDCGLDRYFPLVVQAIEEVNSRQEPLAAGS